MSQTSQTSQTVVVGGGPAGLAAAYRLTQLSDRRVLLLERSNVLGGLAASFRHGDYTLDYGPHRLHSEIEPRLLADLRHLLGDELEQRPRRGQIRMEDRLLPYPLGPASLLRLGPNRLLRLGAGALSSRIAANRSDRSRSSATSYEDVLKTRLGEPLYDLFYGPYAEKVWGLSGSQIAADQAEKRVNQRGLSDLARLALGKNGARYYLYPRGGFGRIPAAYAQALESNSAAHVRCQAAVEKVEWREGRVEALHYSDGEQTARVPADDLVWTASLAELARLFDPPAPTELRETVARLRYRAVVLCYVVLDVGRVGQFDTYYFPEKRFPFNRVTEQKNFSGAMIPDHRTVLCLDMACDSGGDLFAMSDEQLRALVVPRLEEAGLLRARQVVDVFSRRFRQAYPIYDLDYYAALQQARQWLDGLHNLWLIGRHGLFLHDNVHHSLLMGYQAAEALSARGRDSWPAILARFSRFRVAD